MDETTNQLLNEVQTISESYEKIAEATGENFNIFSVLKVETDEVSTHSRFIAELLKPKGLHGQGNKFLKAFSERVENKEGNKINIDTTKVSTEVSSTNGRIDILLKDAENNSVVIENKIYSDEGKDQLNNYVKDYPNSLKLYLTLYGEEPSDEKFKPISYEEDIINWLEKCKELAVDAPILRESIAQYINLLKKLTNQNLNRKMSEEVTKRVLKDQSSFNAFKTMVKGKNKVIIYSLENNFLEDLKKVEREYGLKLELDKSEFFKIKKPYRRFSFTNEKLKANNLKIFFEFEQKDYKILVFGFKYIEKDKKDHYSYQDISERFQKEFGKSKKSNSSLCYITYSEYLNWSNLDTLEQVIWGSFLDDFKNKLKRLIALV